MLMTTIHSDIEACAAQVLHRVGILDNGYFARLADGRMTHEQFRESQAQFYFAVAYFSRPMAVLMARLPRARDRLEILRNITEEHGNFHEGHFHATTFRSFLASIGSTVDLDDLSPSAPVHAFNNALMAACANDEIEVGMACLGIIEMAFADISTLIGRAVVARGWVAEDQLVHYRLHAEIDHAHAEAFFDAVAPGWAVPEKRTSIRQGLELGAYVFDRLYRDL